jgi:hypothetical protein
MKGFRHTPVAPDIYATTVGTECPNCFDLNVYQVRPGRPATTQTLIRRVEEGENEWWARVLGHAKALQSAHPLPWADQRNVVVIRAIYDAEIDARMRFERLLWQAVRFDPSHQFRTAALLVLANFYPAHGAGH